jgi:hypothetical protein
MEKKFLAIKIMQIYVNRILHQYSYTPNLSQKPSMNSYHEEIGSLAQESASKYQDPFKRLANVHIF